ncbi:hypothetical protein DFA_05101 [Cavenderia fasciculata]|uniref:Uncharacterized protein n=1 Tax=Cavenderia fasciculata TaxID=261658 RepID=F4PNB8_CACFS|nr:uncharacterized protein DFA_05101 [Cavenderia fasciculata]EGG22971.1 hypothetical protein DFA_05101 [Cavenderia fasciculata]|eukprot:XP_004360822.1 hypothetical protein DFA_05101 [Cavenderia fasciculata]
MTASSNGLLESRTVRFTDLHQKLLNGPLIFSLGSNTNVTLSCRDLSVMKDLQQRADQVILDIAYRVCNLEYNIASDDDDDLIYDQKQSPHPSLALIYLLFIQLPDGTENDKCLFHHLSYETKKHMHELLLNHIKQSKEFIHHEKELIQLMLSNQYGIIRMNNYDAHIRDKYLDVIYDTLDTIFGVYKDPNISKSVCRDKPVYMFLLVLKEYSFQDQRGKELKRMISQTVFLELSDTEWTNQISCDFLKEYIKTIFLDAHNDGYFVPQQPNDYMDAEDWNNPLFYANVFDSKKYSDIKYEKPMLAKKIQSFKATQHQVLSILFEHFNRCLTQTSGKDKLIVLKLWNMFNHKSIEWKTYFSIDLLKTVISESLKEDNELVQCELLEFIYQFCNMPYYIDMLINSIEFRDIINDVFNHIINQAPPYSRLLSSLIKVCDQDCHNKNQFASLMLKKLFPTEPLWQECIVNLALKSVQSNHREVIDSAISFVYTFTYHHIPQFTSLKALSTAIIGLLDRFQNDDKILEHVIELFGRIIVRLGPKEINQLVQRILFSKQYKQNQINTFVRRYLIQWIGKSVNNLSIYLPSAMKIILLHQPIDRYSIDRLVIMYKQPHKTTNRYIQHLITPMFQLHASPTTYSNTTEKAKASQLLSILYTRTAEYKGIHHQESTLLFQQILDSLAEAMPSDLSRTDPDALELLRYHLAAATKMVKQIILREGNITTDQILQIIDLIVQAQHYTINTYSEFRRSWDELPEIDILVKILVSMDDQWNTIEMIASSVIDMVVDWINQNMGSTKSDLSSKVELVIDFYDQLNIVPPSITISPTEEISYSEWIDRLMVALEKNTRLTKELKQIKEKINKNK